MPRARVKATGKSAAALKDLRSAAKSAGRSDLNRNMRNEIGAAGRPVVSEIRAAALAVQVTVTEIGGKPANRRRTQPNSSGLRARVATATRLSQTQRGIRFVVDAKKVDPQYGVTLPRYLDASLPRFVRWRSPIWHPGPIGTAPPSRVKQQTGSPFFFTTIERHEPQFRRAVDDAALKTLRQLLG